MSERNLLKRFDGKPLPQMASLEELAELQRDTTRVKWSEVNDPKRWTTQPPCDLARLQRECLEAFARQDEQKRKLLAEHGERFDQKEAVWSELIKRGVAVRVPPLVEGRLGTYQGFTFVDRIVRSVHEAVAAPPPAPHPNAQHAAPIARALRRSNARQTAAAWERMGEGES